MMIMQLYDYHICNDAVNIWDIWDYWFSSDVESVKAAAGFNRRIFLLWPTLRVFRVGRAWGSVPFLSFKPYTEKLLLDQDWALKLAKVRQKFKVDAKSKLFKLREVT